MERVDRIDPVAYSLTRNHMDGSVTRLSPYISRGVISTRQVFLHLRQKGYPFYKMEKLLQELAWRDYFQRVAQANPALANQALKQEQTGVVSAEMPVAIAEHSTGIQGIDQAIEQLYQTGYMHNHARMYVAALACNIAHTQWQLPSKWMYYHLLDADFASNACSWQWVAGCFSSKKYVADQNNINKYCNTLQRASYLDIPYEELGKQPVPEALVQRKAYSFNTPLPAMDLPAIDPSLPVFLYTPYHLDPLWRKQEKANRILLLDPEHFRQFPMSSRSIEFIIALAREIDGMQIFSGTHRELRAHCGNVRFVSKEHPLFSHLSDVNDDRDWMFPDVKGYYPSFFSYWKKCIKGYPM